MLEDDADKLAFYEITKEEYVRPDRDSTVTSTSAETQVSTSSKDITVKKVKALPQGKSSSKKKSAAAKKKAVSVEREKEIAEAIRQAKEMGEHSDVSFSYS